MIIEPNDHVENQNPPESDQAYDHAVDGLLRELSRNSSSTDEVFVSRVMDAVRGQRHASPAPASVLILRLMRPAMGIAAALLLAVGLLVVRGKYFPDAARPGEPGVRILVASPSGLLARGNSEFSIENGMRVAAGDRLEIFSHDAAYLEVGDAPLLEIGTGTRFGIEELPALASTSARSGTPYEFTLAGGAVTVDTSHLPGRRAVKVTSRSGLVLSAIGARFTVLCDSGFTYLEVERGRVRVTGGNAGNVMLLRAGESCMHRADGEPAVRQPRMDERTVNILAALKSRLPAGQRMYRRLRQQLGHKRNVDICMRKLLKSSRRPIS